MNIAEGLGVTAAEVFSNEFVIMRYSVAESLLFIDWQRQVEPEERKHAFIWACQFSEDELVRNWLINDEEIYIITTEEMEWVTYNFTRLAAEAGIHKIAVYLPEYFYSHLLTLTDFTQGAQDIYKQLGVTEHEVFTDYEMALNWLRLPQAV